MAKWNKSPVLFLKSIEEDLVKARNEIAADMFQSIINQSPVDTGTYKANHRVTLDSEDVTYNLTTTDTDGQETLRAGLSVIQSNNKPFGMTVIQNNLPYAQALENGHSEQASSGVYGISFDAIMEKYK